MFNDALELAENKLLLLYILQKIKLPVSKNQLTEIILKNNFINYFTLQQYIAELIAADFVQYNELDEKRKLTVSPAGDKVLNMFINRISESKKNMIDKYIAENINQIKNDISLTADYTLANDNSFTVNLKAVENNITLIDLKLNVVTNKQARELCKKWKTNSSELYTQILKVLIED